MDSVSERPPHGAYAAIMGTFAGGLAVAGAVARALGRDPQCHTALDFAVLGAASFKAAHTLSHDEVTSFIREPFVRGRAHAGESEEPSEELPLEALPLPQSGRTVLFRLLVKHAFQDVHAYFFGGSGPAMRQVVARSLDGLDGGPLVVVGHSLGTIIAYEVLMEQGREVELLVTLGSPLAISEDDLRRLVSITAEAIDAARAAVELPAAA